MTPSQIIARARKWIADTTNYPDADGILDFNFVYQDLISEIITELDEDYFFDIAKTATVVWQEEYLIKQVGTPTSYKVNQIKFWNYIEQGTASGIYTSNILLEIF
jgi:hypothetical protein